MGIVTVNGQSVFETRLTVPRTGAWHADLLVDDPDGLAGQATIVVDGGDGAPQTYVGTIMRAGVFVDTSRVRVVAGAGGLGLSATPRHYVGTNVGIVLSDLLAAAGETLSGTADQGVLGSELDAWTTTAAPIGTLITLLLAAAAPGAVWRMVPDGTLWVGNETWPDAGIDPSLYQIFQDDAERAEMRIGVDAPLALVGTTFEARQVSATEATVGQGEAGVEMRVWFETGTPGTKDQLRAALTELAQRATASTDRIDYSRTYPGTIVSQSGGTVDVQPDQVQGRDLLPDMASVTLCLPPGTSVEGLSGRVRIGWFGGDPARPYATACDAAMTASTIVLAVAAALGAQLSLGTAAAPPALLGAKQAADATLFAAIATAAGTAASTVVDPSVKTFLGALSGAIGTWTSAAAAANAFLSTKVGIAP